MAPWFGLYLPQMRMDFPTIVERVRAAEDAGFDGVWFMDHLAPPRAPEHDVFEAWTLAAAVAPCTTRIRIGHLVGCDAFRHPALLAKMAATLDVISGGRLDLGLGWGSVPAELHTYGFDPRPAPERVDRLRETLEILGLMFSGEVFSYDGLHYRLEEARGRPVPVQERVPLHLGGAGPELTMPLVRRYAHWWNCPSYAVARLDELQALAGDARISVQHPVGLAGGDADRTAVVASAERRFGSWGGLVAGTPAEVADALASEAAAGVEGFVVQLHDFGHPDTVHRFMREVAPSVRDAARR